MQQFPILSAFFEYHNFNIDFFYWQFKNNIILHKPFIFPLVDMGIVFQFYKRYEWQQ